MSDKCIYCGGDPEMAELAKRLGFRPDIAFAEARRMAQRIKELEQPWISVKDRFPEYDKPVLGYCPIYGRALRVYSRIAPDIDAGYWDDVINGNMGGLPPTHWMHIPQPPTEGDSDE